MCIVTFSIFYQPAELMVFYVEANCTEALLSSEPVVPSSVPSKTNITRILLSSASRNQWWSRFYLCGRPGLCATRYSIPFHSKQENRQHKTIIWVQLGCASHTSCHASRMTDKDNKYSSNPNY